MKTFIFVYLVIVLINVLLTAVMYLINPKMYEGCDFRLLPNIIGFFLWPVIWGKIIIGYISKRMMR